MDAVQATMALLALPTLLRRRCGCCRTRGRSSASCGLEADGLSLALTFNLVFFALALGLCLSLAHSCSGWWRAFGFCRWLGAGRRSGFAAAVQTRDAADDFEEQGSEELVS